MRTIIGLCVIAAIACPKETPDFRLPLNFKPINYRLDVITYLDNNFTFNGVVHIKMTCSQTTNTIVLHSMNLNVNNNSVSIVDSHRKIVPVNCVSFVPEKNFMYVNSSEKFKLGNEYVLTIKFAGNINDDLVGYYRSTYVDKQTNQTRWLAVTQFEPLNARRAFPCFDEPELKATFKIRLGHHKQLTAVSNMKLINTTPLPSNPDYVLDEFEESLPMSTYLVAYMVSDFDYIESDNCDDEVIFRIVVRKDVADQTKLASNAGPLVLKYYEDYFDEKFPLSKQDMVAIPDFSAGAMENWGLVIYREAAVLIDPTVATIDSVYQVAENIAHELAHQWFGNLVTMKWWTGLWLNEGFATYIGARGVDFLYPEWNSLRLENVQNFLQVMDLDSLQSSHPVSVTIRHPDEIGQLFDTISYQKGSCLLHMMNMFLGEETFKQGIRNYIDKHKFSNAEQDDLWSSLTEKAHRRGSLAQSISVKEIMDTWTLQTGYPVLKVIRDYSTNTVTLSQVRYLTFKPNSTDNKATCWWIPLTMTTSTKVDFTQTKAKMWLNCKNNNLKIPLTKGNNWVIFNVQMVGLFRVLYDTRNLMCIISTLNDRNNYNKIHTLNRVQLIADSFSFSQIGELDYDITFHLLKYLIHENEYMPWMAALNGLSPISKLMKRTPNEGIFKNYMKRMLSLVYNQFRNMNVELENYEDIQFKKLVIDEACRQQMQDCIDQAQMLFKQWMQTKNPDSHNILPREFKEVIYCQAIKYGGVDEWNFLWKRYQRSNVASEIEIFLSALGCSSETWILNRYLNWTIGENSIIRKQDAITVFYSVANNDI